MSVLLPDPDGPTSATDWPAVAKRLISFRTGTPAVYSNETSRNSTLPSICSIGAFAGSAASSRASARISRIRSRPAKASESCVPIETIWTTGPTTSARYSVKETSPPRVIRWLITSRPPTSSTTTPTIPTRNVVRDPTPETMRIVPNTRRSSLCAPPANTRSSCFSAV